MLCVHYADSNVICRQYGSCAGGLSAGAAVDSGGRAVALHQTVCWVCAGVYFDCDTWTLQRGAANDG